MNEVRVYQTDELLPDEIKQQIRERFRGLAVVFISRGMQFSSFRFRKSSDGGLSLWREEDFEDEVLIQAEVIVLVDNPKDFLMIGYSELLEDIGCSEAEVLKYSKTKAPAVRGSKKSRGSNLGSVVVVANLD